MYNKAKWPNSPLSFSNLLEDFLNPESHLAEFQKNTPVLANIIENDANYEIHLVAPGLRKEDFKIDVDKNLLNISYEHESEKKEEKEKFLYREFHRKSFKRSFNLSNKIDLPQIKANYENGILNVVLPKVEKEDFKNISINVE